MVPDPDEDPDEDPEPSAGSSRSVGFAARARVPAAAFAGVPAEWSAVPAEAGVASASLSAAATGAECGPAREKPSATAAAPSRAPRVTARLTAYRLR